MHFILNKLFALKQNQRKIKNKQLGLFVQSTINLSVILFTILDPLVCTTNAVQNTMDLQMRFFFRDGKHVTVYV